MHRGFIMKNTIFGKKITFSLIFILFAVCTSSTGWSTIYYVDSRNGNDGNSGISQDFPWKLIGKVNASQFQPGDQVLFKRGEIWRETLSPQSAGVADNPIKFGAYGTGLNPTISGANSINWGIVASKNYLFFENFIVEGANLANIIVTGNGTRGCTISYCESRFGGGDGVTLWNSVLGGGHIISNCSIHDNKTGVNGYLHIGSTQGNETIIQNNVVYRNQLAGIVWRGNYAIIEKNDVHDNGNISSPQMGIHVFSGAVNEGTGDHNIIRYNKVYNQLGSWQDGAGIAIDQWCDYNEIYYNVAYNNDGPGIYLFDAANCKIFNNVCYANCKNTSGQLTEKGEIRITSSGVPNDLTKNTEIINNIGYATRAGVYAIYVDVETATHPQVISNNLWYRNDSSNWYFWGDSYGKDLNTWRSLSKTGVSDLNSDPNFVDVVAMDFHIKAISPCINAGSNVGLWLDFDNNPLSQGTNPTIGSFQFKSTAPPVPSTPSNIRIS